MCTKIGKWALSLPSPLKDSVCVLVCMVQHVCGCGGIDVCDVACIPMVWYVCGSGVCVCVCVWGVVVCVCVLMCLV